MSYLGIVERKGVRRNHANGTKPVILPDFSFYRRRIGNPDPIFRPCVARTKTKTVWVRYALKGLVMMTRATCGNRSHHSESGSGNTNPQRACRRLPCALRKQIAHTTVGRRRRMPAQ
jgi:hypothetical protein